MEWLVGWASVSGEAQRLVAQWQLTTGPEVAVLQLFPCSVRVPQLAKTHTYLCGVQHLVNLADEIRAKPSSGRHPAQHTCTQHRAHVCSQHKAKPWHEAELAAHPQSPRAWVATPCGAVHAHQHQQRSRGNTNSSSCCILPTAVLCRWRHRGAPHRVDPNVVEGAAISIQAVARAVHK